MKFSPRSPSIYGMYSGLHKAMASAVTCALIAGAVLIPLTTPAFAAQAPWPVDLTKSEIYLRQGFDHRWTGALPGRDDGWVRFPPERQPSGNLSVPRSGLPGLPGRTFLSLKSTPPETFTYVTSFTLDESRLAPPASLALYCSYIGGNWEIFCNGTSVAREWHPGKDGSIEIITGIRNILVPLDARLLRSGENILAFRVRGDPTYATTGFYHARGYLVGDLDRLAGIKSESSTLVLIFIYLLFGLYHIFFFLYRRNYLYILFFGLFSVSFFLYQFTQTAAFYRIVRDVNVIDRFELAMLFTLLPLVIAFIDTVQTGRIGRPVMFLSAGYGLLIALLVPTPLPFTFDIQRIFQVSLFLPLGYILFYQMIYRFFIELRARYRELNPEAPLRAFTVVRQGFTRSVTGKLFLGVLLMIACSAVDNIDNMFLHRDLNLSQYAFLLLIFAITLILANNFLFIEKKVKELNADLHRKIEELESSHEALSRSEEKYRLLVEGSGSYIFSIDDSGTILSANNTLVREQKLDAADLRGHTIFDLIYNDPTDKDVVNRLVSQKISDCISTSETVMLKVNVRSPYYNEPKESLLRLEYLKSGSGKEILCRISPSMKDSLLKYLIHENQRFSISNHLTVAEEITHRLVRNVERYLDNNKIQLLRISLREMIINAIEHGNLEISYDDKTRETLSGDYLKYIERLQNIDEYKHRKVTIDYVLSDTCVIYHISDDGAGFDHQSLLTSFPDRANEEMLAHGRGITMAMNFFDLVEFNDKGNQVTLKKIFARP